MKTAPMIQRWKLNRLSRGNATSLAPSMIGSTKLPRDPGMLGMMTRNTMTAPCRVNMMLYVSGSMIVWPGAISSVRMIRAKMPPTRNDTSTPSRYMTPIRLWSRVKTQEATPLVQVR